MHQMLFAYKKGLKVWIFCRRRGKVVIVEECCRDSAVCLFVFVCLFLFIFVYLFIFVCIWRGWLQENRVFCSTCSSLARCCNVHSESKEE